MHALSPLVQRFLATEAPDRAAALGRWFAHFPEFAQEVVLQKAAAEKGLRFAALDFSGERTLVAELGLVET